jgi:hypothetical protein
VTQFPTYHDPFAANIPPDVVAAIEESYGLPILEAVEKYRYLVAANIPDVVATIEEQCGMPFEEAVEKYGGRPILCDDGSYVSIADPPGCGPEHFAAKAEAYRLLFERQDRARTVTDARAALRLDAAPVKPARKPRLPRAAPPPDGLRTPAEAARKVRKPRRPSISKMIAQAEKAGKPVTSITTPDGMTLRFGEPEPAAPENPRPLDEFRTKETKQ